jgi:hypothetical protein
MLNARHRIVYRHQLRPMMEKDAKATDQLRIGTAYPNPDL